MGEIYHPEWDKVTNRSAFKSITETDKKRIGFTSVDDPAKVGMVVFAHYRNELIGLKITEAITETEFIATITSFSPPAEHYEDLSIDQQVCINRDEISGIDLG